MFGNFSYLVHMAPLLLVDVLLAVFFSKIVFRYSKTILGSIIFFMLWYFVVDPLAVSVLHIWGYGSNKILGIWIAGTVIEEFIWIVLVAFLFSVASLVLIDKRLKRK